MPNSVLNVFCRVSVRMNVPEMNGIGAQEICVTTAMGVCDFISAMDTARTPEWNCWYHIMNCGFPLKASGETDFPCISGSRVGEGRVYVQLGKVDRVDGLGPGRDLGTYLRGYVQLFHAHPIDLGFVLGRTPIAMLVVGYALFKWLEPRFGEEL